jgi:hypothetical protein
MSQVWTPDSKGVIDATFDYAEEGPSIDARLHEVENLAAEEMFPRATFSGYNRRWWPESCRERLWLSAINTESPFGMIFEDAPRTRASIMTWYARRPEVRMTRFVTFPGNPEVSEWRFSPNGEEIVWLTTDAPTGPASWVYEDDSHKRPAGSHFLRLWLSNWDGSGQRLLGSIELTKGDEYYDWHKFGWIRFIPGSRAISFVFKHRLYRLELP